MAVLMAALTLIALLVGPTLLTGQPQLILVGVALAAAVLLVARRARRAAARH
ncbi:TctA family transporter [Actinoplanes octamycinicus]|uniref:TctA family transporter n=1 Tax=Actinoplanes octamycinicus TaxID=135948 RepID=A0A7W7MD46_9ACTN|nr:hypothetical protein [Actinoplanes octamycinicus]MBB4745803.1 TctA family transporter [Actinoplanes octamycinicus]GIE63605.1 hypothetical protein Aoc01nite_90070 [Actinoplanes octamycinicus]